MRTMSLAVAVGGAIALALVMWGRWVRTSAPASLPGAGEAAAAPAAGAHHALSRDAPPKRIPVGTAQPLPIDSEPSQSSHRFGGQVVSAANGMPLAAWVQAGDRGVLADAKTGRFSIHLASADEHLRFSAEGHQEATLRLEDYVEEVSNEVDVGSIELEPKHSLRIRVVDERGNPVAGARVLATAVNPPGGVSDALCELGRTGDSGVLSVKVGQPLAVFAHLGFRTSDLLQCDLDADCQLVVGGAELRLGLKDSEAGQPVEGLPLELRRLSGYPYVEFAGRSGTDGLFDGPLPPGRYTATLRSPSVFFDEEEPAARDSISGLGARNAAVELKGSCVEPHWLHVVKRPSLLVEARDIDSRRRLDVVVAWISSWEEPPFVPKAAWTKLGGDSLEVTDGIVPLHAFGVLFGGGQGGQLRLSLTSPGYVPGHIIDPLAAVTPVIPYVVFLQPGDTRSLQLRTTMGAAYRRKVLVRENGNVVGHGWPDADGRLSEFPWAGGTVTVHWGSYRWSSQLAAVPATLLRSEETPIVTIDADAEIRVQLAKTPPPLLVCVGEPRERYHGRLDGDELVFDQLTPGRYALGVPEALTTSELQRVQGFETFPILLGSGEVRVLAWDDAWSPLEETFTGHVGTIGIDPCDVEVVPRWGPPELPLASGGLCRFPVAEDGSFRLLGVRVRPSSLMFVRSWEGTSLMPIGVCAPEEASVLECTPVKVVAQGEPGQLVRVSFAPRIEGNKVLGFFAASAPAGTAIDLGPLPSATNCLRVVVNGKGQDVNLTLRPGDPALVRVE